MLVSLKIYIVFFISLNDPIQAYDDPIGSIPCSKWVSMFNPEHQRGTLQQRSLAMSFLMQTMVKFRLKFLECTLSAQTNPDGLCILFHDCYPPGLFRGHGSE